MIVSVSALCTVCLYRVCARVRVVSVRARAVYITRTQVFLRETRTKLEEKSYMEDCSPYNNYIIVRTKYRRRLSGAGFILSSFLRFPILYRLSAQRCFRFRSARFFHTLLHFPRLLRNRGPRRRPASMQVESPCRIVRLCLRFSFPFFHTPSSSRLSSASRSALSLFLFSFRFSFGLPFLIRSF